MGGGSSKAADGEFAFNPSAVMGGEGEDVKVGYIILEKFSRTGFKSCLNKNLRGEKKRVKENRSIFR